jgi:hypothetical protein
MTFRQISDCLDGGLMAGLIGSDVGCSPSIDTRSNETADGSELIEPAAPAVNERTGAPGPGRVAAHEGGRSRRLELVVINGCTASKARRSGAAPRRAVHLFIATVDGERVHSAASR